ncbi:hypothetical protein CEXT_501511 [Caerostris extrusa]|uniref:Uncharacterized protein n=1 Tax=Caerostris extrusa TaxID=172846 RepID=A0AAV4QCZ2_CAEEX|nr:hypothetical protein CEXT_501511 [Caerostris extrusa]
MSVKGLLKMIKKFKDKFFSSEIWQGAEISFFDISRCGHSITGRAEQCRASATFFCATRSFQHFNSVHVWIESFSCKICSSTHIAKPVCNCLRGISEMINISSHLPTT